MFRIPLYLTKVSWKNSSRMKNKTLILNMEHQWNGRFLFTEAMSKRLLCMKERHEEILGLLSSNSGQLDSNEITNLSIELSELEPTMESFLKMENLEKEIKDLNMMIEELESQKEEEEEDSKELRDLAWNERRDAYETLKALEVKIQRSLLPRDKVDDRGAILEIRAGTGGDEASLFSMDVLKMYQKYSLLKGWKFEILHCSESEIGGCKDAAIALKGRGVFGKLKYESGVHRVQRVPINDSRVHTSAITVAVLPEAEEVDVQIKPTDLRIDTYRSSGPGGQHVNCTDSAVRVTHLPTGIVAAIQDERSQHKNREKALKLVYARVYAAERERLLKERSAQRSELIGTGDRSERIRTYNFPQSRVSDHRIHHTVHGIERMLNGELLDELLDQLILDHETQQLESLKHT